MNDDLGRAAKKSVEEFKDNCLVAHKYTEKVDTLLARDRQNRLWLSIRGTDLFDDEDLISDGLLVFKDSISLYQTYELFEYFQTKVIPQLEKGEKIRLTGHSLGGVKAQMLMLAFPEYIEQVHIFNSPSVIISNPIGLNMSEELKKEMDPSLLRRMEKLVENISKTRTPNDISIYDYSNKNLLSPIANLYFKERYENSIQFGFNYENTYSPSKLHSMAAIMFHIDEVSNNFYKNFSCRNSTVKGISLHIDGCEAYHNTKDIAYTKSITLD